MRNISFLIKHITNAAEGCKRRMIMGKETFSAPVVYVQPDYEELQFSRISRYIRGFQSAAFRSPCFEEIGRCKNVSREEREVAFEYVHMDHDVSTNEVLVEMDRDGLRPALYEELLGFGEKYRREPRDGYLVALGSLMDWDIRIGRRGVAVLKQSHDRCDTRQILELEWIGNDNDYRLWKPWHSFLAVRE